MMKGGTRIAILAMWFGIGLVVASIVTMIVGKMGYNRPTLLLGATLQNILLFAAPALLLAYTVSTKPLRYCGLAKNGSLRDYLFMLLIFAAALPALNSVIEWNANINIPGMEELVQMMRDMEDAAQGATDLMMTTNSIGGLAVNVLVVGCLTGLCEELFFRGALQRTLMSCRMNPHVAIWVSAFIFSFMHFQFFGFVPRMLLGAWFGYLYLWSGSIWLNSLAHALNNSLVIVFSWLIGQGYLSEQFDSWGVAESGFPVIPAISALLFTLAVIASLHLTRGTPRPYSDS